MKLKDWLGNKPMILIAADFEVKNTHLGDPQQKTLYANKPKTVGYNCKKFIS